MSSRSYPMALSILWRYGFAIVLVGAAFGLCSLLRYVTHYRILIPFFAAVIATGWCGGRGPAGGAGALRLLAGGHFFWAPPHTLPVRANREGFFFSFSVGLFISGWGGSFRQRFGKTAAH